MSARGFIAGAVAVGAFGYAATHLALALTLPPPQEAELARLAPAEVAEEAPAAPAAPWPAVFGTAPPPAPEAPAPAEPEITTAYSLKGLVADAGGGWAIIDDGSGERLVRPGDVLADGTVVVSIGRNGVTLAQGDKTLLVVFRADPAPAAPPPPEVAAKPAAPGGPPIAETRVSLPLSGLDRRDFRKMLARAGAGSEVTLDDGSVALEILHVRPGQLYDRLGLAVGDRVLRLNGISVGDGAGLARAAGQMLASGSVRLEILRNGQIQAINVELVSDE